MIQVAGFVLTGGRSSRMGRDKALLPIGPTTLAEQVAAALGHVTEQVLLIGHPERYAHLRYRCVADLHPDLGPLSGVETALSLEVAEWHLIVSCDAYNLRSAWLQLLVADAKQNGALCTVARDPDGQLQPLCAVYRSECRHFITKALADGRLRAMDLLRELNAKPVQLDGSILNLNTFEQYQEVVNATRGQ